ncbi:nucleotide sugar dehydrogenase [Haloarcula salinisoli]|uniref:UDP-N-acetyl-D-mannosamine dehydrogenase n=1 Tax=Haloarcula salinisoli TaxID=2487746 RepID=A0A8J7YMA5_9EURY|nr:nucleotide sugar dehydrogenase [Halomicroarcula salinisoli]MBX0305829.1 nucleotide sugar dehydrogenase [Halomicroarcula salinisoli]
MAHLSIVGMGYVGLPLALAFDAEGHDVVGFDTDARKVARFRRGEDPTSEVGSDAIDRSDITFTTSESEIESSDYYVITVPTPIDESGAPDLAFIEAAGETVGATLSDGSTVVLESTVYPGATREVLLPVLEEKSGKTAGTEFYLGYSPERLVPGNAAKGLSDIVKIVSGHDEVALERLRALYGDVVDAGLHPAPSMEVAEAAKCLENTQRDLNIALMNEFAFGCRQLDHPIDARDVIDAASTKWNFHEYHPGTVGGHCIPVDPNYLIWQFEQHGFDSELIRTARSVNDEFATQMATAAIEALGERAQTLNREYETINADGGQVPDGSGPTAVTVPQFPDDGPRLLVLGFAYKPGTTDVRSPVLRDAIEQLQEVVEVVGVDPHISNEAVRNDFDVPVQESLSVDDFDGLLLSTPHDAFRSLDLGAIRDRMNELPVLVDVTGTYDSDEAAEHGFIYRGI